MSWMSYFTLWICKTTDVLFQVEPNTKLFPAVFIQPSNQNLVQLELGKLKVQSSFRFFSLLRSSSNVFF